MGKKILALNIGASSVTLAEYERTGKGLSLANYGSAALAAPLDAGDIETVLSPALMEIVREKGIKPGRVAMSVPGQMVFPRYAAIAAAGGDDKFEQLVRYEIEQNIPFPVDEMVCDSAILGETPSGDKAVVIVAAKIDQMEALAGAVKSAGFSPEIVDVAPIALANVLKANQAAAGAEGECAVILDIGAKTTTLAIVEGEKLYNRSIPVAGNTVTKEIAQLLGCTLDEAEKVKRESAYIASAGTVEDEDETRDRIAKTCRAVMTRLHAEISRSINFYRSQQGGGAPVKLYLSGGTSLIPGVDAFFAETLQIETAWLNPFETISAGRNLDAQTLETDTAVLAPTAGVALHAAGMAAIPIDLMPPSLIEAKAEAARVPFVAAGAAAMVAAVACWFVMSAGETEALEERVETVRAEADRLESVKKGAESAAAGAAEAYTAATNLAARLSLKGGAAARVRTVRSAIEPDLWISRWSESEEGGVRTVRVTVRGWKDRTKQMVEREISSRASAAAKTAEAANAAAPTNAPTSAAKKPAATKPAGTNVVEVAKPLAAGGAVRGLTAGMVVVARLVASDEFEPGSVKIVEGRQLGKDGCLEEFTVEMQFKEISWK